MRRLLPVLLLAVGCDRTGAGPTPPAPEHTMPPALATTTRAAEPIAQLIFDHGLTRDWKDWGWAAHDDVPSGEAKVDFSGWRGWQLVHASGPVAGAFGGLSFRFKAPEAYGTFLTVHLGDSVKSSFPEITVDPARIHVAPDGWSEAYLGMEELDPDGMAFDRVVFFVTKSVPSNWVSLDKIGLTQAPEGGVVQRARPVEDVTMSVDGGAAGTPISPLIYGVAYEFQHCAKDDMDWSAGATARRWGGNTTTRYNWELGNAWNTANDWFFENVQCSGDPAFSYRRFLEGNRAHRVASALTVPILGWVAKDTTSVGFPRSQNAEQGAFDGSRPEAGNGLGKNGKKLDPGPPTNTSVAAPVSFIKRWIEAIVADDKRTGQRSVQQYILDNEPNLWSDTHRDVHPETVTYDELLKKTIAVGTAIREADPDAVIAGPAEWGWPNYFYSNEDMRVGVALRPDRRMHGDKELIAYYLEKLREHEQKTGTRILDVLDLHFYPQGAKVYSPASDRATAELRIRQTRGLWDETYVDESWIKDTVKLIPRMKRWIADNYPGRGISIGEWSFGGEHHPSGGLAIAEALGRFGQQGVTSAFYWVYPAENSPAFWAFRAYRNYDGKGGHFESVSVPAKTDAPTGSSIFASRSADGSKLVLVVLNFSSEVSRRAKIDLGRFVPSAPARIYSYRRGAGLLPGPPASGAASPVVVEIAPQSFSVIEIDGHAR